MATATVTQVVTHTVNATSATATTTARIAAQGGILQGRIPTQFLPNDPIAVFIIQAVIVISLTRLLQWPLSKLRQPRVIAEVLTGIVLGPSIMGRIPGFTANIFPAASMPPFALAANLGLVLYLFLVGLEVDIRFLLSNWRIALGVGAMGMILPFGLGFAIAYGLYEAFHNEPGLVPISFGTYGLFIGIAIAITAFPVLCRILTSLNLLGTPVGVIVLSAGIANDVVGWILLALCVTLVNSGAGLTALYIFLIAVGYALFLGYPVRIAFTLVLRKSGALTTGPSQTIIALTLFMVFASAFFTDIIGIHAIFGAFMVGLICPHEGGFAIKLTEKIEDLVSTLFLPLYFALSGLSTNLGLLDNGITWAYVVGVTAVAFFGKFFGGTAAAKLNGMLWGESATIGVLMSCKGLVELIVLNIGLQAKILTTRTFTIFVVMALLTTFATTPLTVWLYPPTYQHKVDLWRKGKIDWDGNSLGDSENGMDGTDPSKTEVTHNILVYLRLDSLPSLFKVVSLFTGGQQRDQRSRLGSQNPGPNSAPLQAHKSGATEQTIAILSRDSVSFERPLRIHGLRLLELTERDSSVMKVSELEEYAQRDPIIKAFGTSAASQRSSRNVTVSGQISLVPQHSFASSLVSRARDRKSDFIIVPWSETGTVSEHADLYDHEASNNPLANRAYALLASEVFEAAVRVANVAIFIDKSLVNSDGSKSKLQETNNPLERRPTLSRSMTGLSLHDQGDAAVFRSLDSRGPHQIRTLYRGTPDDLLAVKIALQMAKNDKIVVHVVKVRLANGDTGSTTPQDRELDVLYNSLTAEVRSHVEFEDLDSQNEDIAVRNALITNRANESSEITLIVGRDARATLTTSGILSPTSTNTGDYLVKTLGTEAAGLLSQMKNIGGNVSLMVVQAKAADATGTAESSPVMARKPSQLSGLT